MISTNDFISNFCLVCWDDRSEGREGCDFAHEYCDMEEDRCVPFTGKIFQTHSKSLNLITEAILLMSNIYLL